MCSFISLSLFPSISLLAFQSAHPSHGFIPPSIPINKIHKTVITNKTPSLSAKKRKKEEESNEEWYSPINPEASPDTVFWEEMERRRLLNTSYDDGVAPASSGGESPIDMVGKIGMDAAGSGVGGAGGGIGGMNSIGTSGVASTIASQSNQDFYGATPSTTGSNALSQKNPGVTISEERSAEATLASYELYAVPDNYLFDDEEEEEAALKAMGIKNDPSLWSGEEMTIEEENAELERQLDEWEKELMGDGVDGSVVGGSSPFFDPATSDEPWDRYGQSKTSDDDGESVFSKTLQRKMDMVKRSHGELLLEYDDTHPEEAAEEMAREEEEYVKSLESIGISSARLENAAVNPKAEAYFRRSPDELQGYDVMWVSAIEQPCIENLHGIFMDYGVQFADNFDDWELGTEQDGLRTIEDVASFKARKVHQVTGLPCIASRTSFEVEPIRPEDMNKINEEAAAKVASSGKKNVKPPVKSPRVISGYRFNDVGEHVDHVVQALMPFSEPTRVTRFRSCLCYYDGDMEIFEYGELDCDIYFSGSMRTFIPMSQALNSMLKTLQLSLDLQFQKWLTSAVNDATRGGSISEVSIKLRDRVLKEAKVLPNDIIDVSSFMDAYVDVDLMDECAKDLAERFMASKPNKILTIATTGLVIAIPMAKYLQVPLVYARKKRSIVMADTFDAGYNSKTIGKDQQLLVSKDHIDPEDRVLIVDDFLSSGSSQEALLRIISEAGATPVGVAVLLEKDYEAGRKSLSGFGVNVESIVRIASVSDGVIRLLEEDGYAKV